MSSQTSNTLRSDIRLVESYIELIKSDIKHIKLDIELLNSDIKHVKSEINHIQSDIKLIKSEIKYVKSDIEYVNLEIKHTKSDIKQVRSDIGSVQAYKCKDTIEFSLMIFGWNSTRLDQSKFEITMKISYNKKKDRSIERSLNRS